MPLRFEDTNEPSTQPYIDAWNRLKKLQQTAIAIWVLFLPYEALVSHETEKHAYFTYPLVILPIVLAWIVIAKMNSFSCPRCGRSFDPTGSQSMWRNGWGARCAHCALPKWGVEEPDV